MDYTVARQNMVESQLRTNKVNSVELLKAYEEVPRETFVPKHLKDVAYADTELKIAEGRYLLQPMVQALLMQAAEIRPHDVVLEIGCGSGYATSILAKLANTVVALEENKALSEIATENLGGLGIDNAVVVSGPLIEGYQKQSPYNVIFLSGAVSKVQEGLVSQLSDRGRLVTVVKSEGIFGKGVLISKFGNTVSYNEIFDAGSCVLPGFETSPAFSF
ncbi:MAG: protein-L-isoaspartate O-methyltransferase [Pseudomonadota bacterium]|nr:protein-L-isoaspartate O-methyltransferase [Pseudomonadota bacterium]